MLLAAIISTASVFGSEVAPQGSANTENAGTPAIVSNEQNTPATNVAAGTPAANTENAGTPAKEEAKAPEQSWSKAKLAAVSAAFGSAANFVSTPAEKLLQQLTRISYLKGGKFEANIPTMAKLITAAALVTAAVKVYQMVNDADDVDANDDEIFGDNN
jgi:hypothetical protein